MTNISLALAFSAGLASFLSPCVLPLVPAYISYITDSASQEQTSEKSKLYVLYRALAFVVGFSVIFIIMGASITSLGKIFIKNQLVFKKIAGFLVFIFGIHMTGIFKIKFFYYEKKFLSFKSTNSALGAVFMGMAFAAGWTPCVGPILSSILLYAGSLETINKGVLLLSVYSLGLGVPFILTALAIKSLWIKLKGLNKYLWLISVFSGILMIIMGILIFTNKMGLLSQYFNFINF
jgi:Cytochrome c biogenesis protein